jgi:hypothetical protein
MYQIFLNQFLGKFYESIETAPKDTFPKKRIENIINTLTYTTLEYIVRGLYEEDKLLFCFQMALKIEMSLGTIDFSDYQTFIKAVLDWLPVLPITSKNSFRIFSTQIVTTSLLFHNFRIYER